MSKNKIVAVLGPTNTGKTFLAIETMLSFDSGMMADQNRQMKPLKDVAIKFVC